MTTTPEAADGGITKFEDIAIDWENAGILSDKNLLQSNLRFMKLLFQAGKPVNTIEYHGGQCPMSFEVDAVTINFLPHWERYECGDFHFPPPASTEQLREQINAVTTFLQNPEDSDAFSRLEEIMRRYNGFFKTQIVTGEGDNNKLTRVVTDVQTALRDGVFKK